MGTVPSSLVEFAKQGDTYPDYRKETQFDPTYGFPNGRKERVMVATQAEMESANLKLELRDYCAHHAIDFYKCRAEKWPMAYKCKHELHNWEECKFDDFVLRMKEYEREKRLLQRAKRKRGSGMSEEMVE